MGSMEWSTILAAILAAIITAFAPPILSDILHKDYPSSIDNPINNKVDLQKENALPNINGLTSYEPDPQYAGAVVHWTSAAYDPENDQMSYKYLLNGKDETGWITDNTWTWKTSTDDIGVCQIDVWVRDGKHNDSNNFDVNKPAKFTIAEQPASVSAHRIVDALVPVAFTLYVHEGNPNGPIIQDATITGHDGSGNSFDSTTDSNGYVTITGDPGTWSFSASADGYETNSWDQEITETKTKDASLKESSIEPTEVEVVKNEAKDFGGVEFPSGMASFADRVVSYNPCDGVKAPYDNPNNALGLPDYNGVASASYVSLGNAKSACSGGSLILEFTDNSLVDIPGNDLYVFEVGPAVETAEVFISTDGQNWINIGRIKGSTKGMDIYGKVSPGQEFHFIKLCDYPDGETSSPPYPGPDIDAVGAIGSSK